MQGGVLNSQLGYVSGAAPRGAAFKAKLQAELQRMQAFLGLPRRACQARAAGLTLAADSGFWRQANSAPSHAPNKLMPRSTLEGTRAGK